MASNQIRIITTLLLLTLAYSSTSATTNGSEHVPLQPVEKHIDVVVEGLVYCQSCLYKGTWSLSNAEPIPKATISVICKHGKQRISFYKAFETDPNGYFYAQLDGFKMGHHLLDHPLQACHVKLVASPRPDCNILTNVNYGLTGAPLRYEDKRIIRSNYEAVIYRTSPLAFCPAHCVSNKQP